MPDHLHAFCAPRDLHFTIETWIAYWKREFSLKHKRKDWKFQSRGWHHRIRNGENHSDKWLYVQENPVRKGLVTRMEGAQVRTLYLKLCDQFPNSIRLGTAGSVESFEGMKGTIPRLRSQRGAGPSPRSINPSRALQ